MAQITYVVGIYLEKKVEAAPRWGGLDKVLGGYTLMVAKEGVLVLPTPPRIFLKFSGATGSGKFYLWRFRKNSGSATFIYV